MDFILLYQMGRVASISLSSLLESMKYDVIKSHFLSKQYCNKLKVLHDPFPFINIRKDIAVAHSIRKKMKKNKFKIITIIRDPFNYFISSICNLLSKGIFTDSSYEYHLNKTIEHYISNKNYNHPLGNLFTSLITWPEQFCEDFLYSMDIGLLSLSFRKDYHIYKKITSYGKKKILLIKFESLPKRYKDCLSSFLNTKEIPTLPKINNSTKEQKRAIEKLCPKEFKKKLYSSSYAKHYGYG